MNKTDILDSLTDFANQRPGLNFADYGDATLYRRDYNKHCARPLHDFRAMLSAIRWRDSLDAGIGCRRDRRYIGSDYYRRGYLAGAMDSDVVNLDNN